MATVCKRSISEIIDDIEYLMCYEPDLGKPERFKKLYLGLLEAKGCAVDETRCPVCNDRLDNKGESPYRNWEFKYICGGRIIFTCDRCQIQVPLNVKDPYESARCN